MRTAILVTLALGAALAQETSDLQPPMPAAPAGSSVYYPGMPVPAPTVVNPAGAAAPGKGEARTGLILNEDSSYGSEEGEAEIQVEAPTANTHVVRRGDTLWGVSATYFHNPWYWPKLWSYNPSITNPHWIYPGDILKLSANAEVATPEPLAANPQPTEPSSKQLQGRPIQPPGLFLRQNGFVEQHELEVAGVITGSKEEKIMLATLDEAYVQYTNKQPLVVGEKYSIYKPIRTVKHPVTGKKLGEIVEIFGEAQVKSVTEGRIARMLITDTTDGVERGYRVGPLRRTFKRLEHRVAERDLSAVVVATLRPIEMVATDTLVFIDRGEKDGVELGNYFTIVRRGDGYQPLLWRGEPVDDRRFPREVLGTVQVVDLRDRLATGWVTGSVKETRIGDRVELHRGE